MKKICLAVCICIATNGLAQTDTAVTVKAAIDTTALLDSMASDLALLGELMAAKTSYFNINVSAGNQTFSKNNYSLNTQQATENTVSIKPGGGYYHKSGFSISGLAYINLSYTKGGFYQYSVTPAYDYSGEGKVAAGISYSRYFTKSKDTIPAFATPYDNELYAYVYMVKGPFLQPGITLGYATGRYTNIYRGKIQGAQGGTIFVTDSQKTKQADFSVSVSVQHDFEWEKIFTKDDDLSFTPTVLLNAGSSQLSVLSHSNKLVNDIIAKRPNNRFRIQNAGFELYSLGLSLNTIYEIGNFYLQPEIYVDYYLPDSNKKITSLFSLTAGINL